LVVCQIKKNKTMSNLDKAKQLIREGSMGTQDKFTEIMMEVKRKNPELTHEEVMTLVQQEFDRFLQFHKNDRIGFPSVTKNTKVLQDRIPVMKIPYGGKKKKGF